MIKDKNMAKNIERESLVSALAHCSLRDLPKIDNGEDIWLYAIAKVEKSDGSTSYALVEKTENLEIRYLKDFGSIYQIRKVVSYHPFSFLKPSYLPKFKSEKKDERLDYLAKHVGKDVDFSQYSKKELDGIILGIAIKNQKMKENYG
jgi:hypothetical protein